MTRPPTTHRPRDFFAGPFHFPRSKCPNPPPFPRRTIGVRHRPSPQGHGRKERGVNAIILHGIAQSCRVKSLPIHEMDMGVASDVIVATITRFAVRIGLPGRPRTPWSAEPPDRSHGITENPTPHLPERCGMSWAAGRDRNICKRITFTPDEWERVRKLYEELTRYAPEHRSFSSYARRMLSDGASTSPRPGR